MKLYEILEAIPVHNWYIGNCSALYAFSNNCQIDSIKAIRRVRYQLKKYGYKCSITNGFIRDIVKL